MRANCVSGRSRERKFTSPVAFLLSSHDHRAGWIDRLGALVGWWCGAKRTHSPASQGAGAMQCSGWIDGLGALVGWWCGAERTHSPASQGADACARDSSSATLYFSARPSGILPAKNVLHSISPDMQPMTSLFRTAPAELTGGAVKSFFENFDEICRF